MNSCMLPIQNNLKLNTDKSLEMIIHSKQRKLINSPPYIPYVSRVYSSTVLSFGSHEQAVVGKAARLMYALKQLTSTVLRGTLYLYGTLRELPSFHN